MRVLFSSSAAFAGKHQQTFRTFSYGENYLFVFRDVINCILIFFSGIVSTLENENRTKAIKHIHKQSVFSCLNSNVSR